MTAVLVHGVPETTAVWDSMKAHLPGDVITLSLPGFGTPLPADFEPTMESYAQWLAGELAAIDEPIRLVAHDWGALLSLRVLATQPANVSSWILDTGNLDEDFVWHDLAQVWQTPGDGEDFMEMMLSASVDDRAAMLVAAGVPAAGATDMAEGIDATMAAAILTLYRSATNIGSEWGPGIDHITAPGMVLEATKDVYRTPASTARLAERTDARVLPLPDCGHWWMLDNPTAAAALITAFWGDPARSRTHR